MICQIHQSFTLPNFPAIWYFVLVSISDFKIKTTKSHYIKKVSHVYFITCNFTIVHLFHLITWQSQNTLLWVSYRKAYFTEGVELSWMHSRCFSWHCHSTHEVWYHLSTMLHRTEHTTLTITLNVTVMFICMYNVQCILTPVHTQTYTCNSWPYNWL